MSIYYVPTVLVIESDTAGTAVDDAFSIIHSVTQLEPKGLLGYTCLGGVKPTEASWEWYNKDQRLACSNGKVVVVEEVI